MIARRRRWWLSRALGRSGMARTVDRIDAIAVLTGLALLLCAALTCLGSIDSLYAAGSRAIAAEASTHHRVDATATAASTSDARIAQQAVQRYTVHVEWLAQNATRDEVVKLDHAVKAGDRVPVWLDDRGRVTSPPLTNADARVDAVGEAILLWVLAAASIAVAVAVLRFFLDRARDRSWDRSLHGLLVDNGGGPTTRTPDGGT